MAPELLWAALAVLALGLVAQSARLLWAQGRGARQAARARRLGSRGEHEAERLLREAGFVVEERQARARYSFEVDGALREVPVRADFLVRRGALRFVAEAKGGERASRPTDRATRRQLLEYLHAYQVDGALLVDASRGEIHLLVLPGLPATRTRARSRFALGLAVGALLGLGLAAVLATALGE